MTIERKDLIRLIKKGDLRGIRHARNENRDFPPLDGETFRNLEVTGLDLSFLDLSNTEWDTCILDKSSFRNANLSGAFFTGCTMLQAEFDRATFQATAIDGCVIRDSTFRELLLNDVELTGSELARCTLEDVTLNDALWEAVTVREGVFCNVKAHSGTWTGLTFRDVVLENVDFEELNIQGCIASGDVPNRFKTLTGRRKHIQ